jgi:hypothetical protein
LIPKQLNQLDQVFVTPQLIGHRKAAFPACCEFGDNFSICSDLLGFVAVFGAGSVRAYGEINADGLRVS